MRRGGCYDFAAVCRVIDSGMFHCLDDGKRSYAAAVHRATRPGATLLLTCFSDADAGTVGPSTSMTLMSPTE